MKDFCVRCQVKPVARTIYVEVLRTIDTSTESKWCVRLCEECCDRIHGGFKQQTQFSKAKFKVGDVVGVKNGCENGWPFKERHTVTWINVDHTVPLYGLDSIGCACVETILEAR